MNALGSPPDPDADYRAVFSHRELVADLLSGFAAREWIDERELTTLELKNCANDAPTSCGGCAGGGMNGSPFTRCSMFRAASMD